MSADATIVENQLFQGQAPTVSPVVVALPRSDLARVAPNYEAMRSAIAVCVKVDEIAKIADVAVAAQAYYRQAQDVDNEMQCSRWRVQAERKLGEILTRMAKTGERRKPTDNQHSASSAMQLADLIGDYAKKTAHLTVIEHGAAAGSWIADA